MSLLTFDDVAAQLSVSRSLIYKLSRAAEYAAEIKAGIRAYEDVPPALTRYLDSGFPTPKRIGRTIRRIRADELKRWLK